jgi:23S rRNA (cytosine1962-C5)-methyltransferase
MNVAGRNKSERGESVMRYNRPATGQAPAVSKPRPPSGQTTSVWIDRSQLDKFTAAGTDTHRLCTTDEGWVERFGREILVSFKNIPARDRLVMELYFWRTSQNFDFLRIFGRFLPKKNEEREKPQLLFGEGDHNLQTIATENFLKYGIDFGAGYSVGLFIDQRENRRYIRQLKPKRVLNCFAYTCSFSVAAASVGALTVNVDLSKKSLERGRENFGLNGLPTTGHRFISDDVATVLPRLARRGEKFDVIILDPPTFSRSHRGKTFHAERDFEHLLTQALELIERDGWILLSTNCSTLREKGLEVMGRYCVKLTRRAGKFHRTPPLPDFPPNTGASTIWLGMR